MHSKAAFRTGLHPFAVDKGMLPNQGWVVKLDLSKHTLDGRLDAKQYLRRRHYVSKKKKRFPSTE